MLHNVSKCPVNTWHVGPISIVDHGVERLSEHVDGLVSFSSSDVGRSMDDASPHYISVQNLRNVVMFLLNAWISGAIWMPGHVE